MGFGCPAWMHCLPTGRKGGAFKAGLSCYPLPPSTPTPRQTPKHQHFGGMKQCCHSARKAWPLQRKLI